VGKVIPAGSLVSYPPSRYREIAKHRRDMGLVVFLGKERLVCWWDGCVDPISKRGEMIELPGVWLKVEARGDCSMNNENRFWSKMVREALRLRRRRLGIC